MWVNWCNGDFSSIDLALTNKAPDCEQNVCHIFKQFPLGHLPAPSGSSVTELLARWSGSLSAREVQVPLVYEELCRIAHRCLAGRSAERTLQATARVYEASALSSHGLR